MVRGGAPMGIADRGASGTGAAFNEGRPLGPQP